MDSTVSAALWVLSKALGPVTDGLVEAWAASSELGPNVSALKMELLHAQGMLDNAQGNETRSPALKLLLHELRQVAYNAEDVLDELDYFRIQDKLYHTYHAADEHAGGCVCNLVQNASHAAKAVARKLKCCPRTGDAKPAGDPDDESEGDQDGDARHGGAICCVCPSVNIGIGRRILFGACSFMAPEEKRFIEAPKMKFYRVEMSKKIKSIIEKLPPLCAKVSTILNLELLESNRRIAQDIATGITAASEERGSMAFPPRKSTNNRPITTPEIQEPKFFGRKVEMGKILHDITEGSNKDLTVLPIVGLGGFGKTALAKHIYKNVDKHFDVKIWICAVNYSSVSRLTKKIMESIPPVKNEESCSPEMLTEQRLKSKRFLLVLDDMWICDRKEEWDRLLRPLRKGKEGNIILVTSRFPAIAETVKTTDHLIELKGLGYEASRSLFLACVYGDKQSANEHRGLAEIGNKIIEKLKGSPLAAKTVGKLLSNNLNVEHWTRVLDSKEWELLTGEDDIMPVLKLSYKYLPFHLQQCFSLCALFPKKYKFNGQELTRLWIGLGILQSSSKTKSIEEIGMDNFNALISHGFFEKDETDGKSCDVIHDLQHDLALMVASNECLSIDPSNVKSVEIWPSVRHLSITSNAAEYADVMAKGNFRRELKKLKTRLEVQKLQTLMVFGEFDESFARSFGSLFREANALRVLCLPKISLRVESILHNFSSLIHLRYLMLGTKYTRDQMQLPRTLSRFYHLMILDLQTWDGSCDLPKDMGNLAKLRHIFTEKDKIHANIHNVGKLQVLQELKKYCVKKEDGGLQLKQLGYMIELRELGIYNLENTLTKAAAVKAKLMDKKYLRKLTLHWDDAQHPEPDAGAMVIESLQPHSSSLQELCIRGHGGLCCPSWLSNEFSVKALRSLHLVGVAWKVLPSFNQIWELHELTLENIVTIRKFVLEQWCCKLKRLTLIDLEELTEWITQDCNTFFPDLQTLEIKNCPNLLELPFIDNIGDPRKKDVSMTWFPKLEEFEISLCIEISSFPPIPWTQTLDYVRITDVGSNIMEELEYSKTSSLSITGNNNLHSLEKVLAFNNLTELQELSMEKCPPLDMESLLMLSSLKILFVSGSGSLFVPLTSLSDAKWQLPVEELYISDCVANGKELSQLLSHLPKLSVLNIGNFKRITRLDVAVEQQQLRTLVSSTAIHIEHTQPAEQHEGIAEEAEVEDDGLLLLGSNLCRSLRELTIYDCKCLSLAAPHPLLNGHEPRGLQALGSLRTLEILRCPKFLSEYSLDSPCYPFPTSVQVLTFHGAVDMKHLSNLTFLTRLYIEDSENLKCKDLAQDQLSQLVIYRCPEFFVGWGLAQRSSKLQMLYTDDFEGVLVKPICSLLSSCLIELVFHSNDEVESFTKKQEEALQLITSLQELRFRRCKKLQCLPAGLRRLTSLKRLSIDQCPAIQSLPKDGLPSSLQELDVTYCGSKDLIQQCRKLKGTIQKIILQHEDDQ